jgi:hypothetical protein
MVMPLFVLTPSVRARTGLMLDLLRREFRTDYIFPGTANPRARRIRAVPLIQVSDPLLAPGQGMGC